MSYQVLARKWRPRNFESLVGQEHVVRALTHALEQQRLHHAYLFTGTRGVGKTTLARILAKSLNCETGITPHPCGKCAACTEIDAGRFVDLLEVDAATNTKVDEMRQLLENAVYSPTRGRFKVYVIDEVHMLSTSAFNAMLKTLEEPPEHVKFILATTDPQKIPVTVLSRCLQFNLKQMPASAITAHLTRVLGEERISAEEGGLKLISASAHGSMRDALSLLDQAIAYSAGDVTEASVRAMLGTVDQGFLFDLAEAVQRGDAAAALATAGQMESLNVSFDAALQDLASLLHRVALAQVAPTSVSDDDPNAARILALAKSFDREEVQLNYQIALHGRQDLQFAPDGYAGFTMALLRMLAFRPSDAAAERPAPAERPAAAPAAPVRSAPRPAAIAPAPAARPAPSRPAPAAQPAKPAAAEAPRTQAGPPPASIGDWPEIVRSLNASGITQQLAQHSALVGYSEGVLELRLSPIVRHYTESKINIDRFRAAIEQKVGGRIQLKIQFGQTGGESAQEKAVEAISNDPFVRGMMEQFDATIDDSSIKPGR